jgi:hypothetical protein
VTRYRRFSPHLRTAKVVGCVRGIQGGTEERHKRRSACECRLWYLQYLGDQLATFRFTHSHRDYCGHRVWLVSFLGEFVYSP